MPKKRQRNPFNNPQQGDVLWDKTSRIKVYVTRRIGNVVYRRRGSKGKVSAVSLATWRAFYRHDTEILERGAA
jgi:hypothetical protein